MKVLLLADLHGNWPALQAVLQAQTDSDLVLCLGDIVGYGPQPAECVAWAMGLKPPSLVIQGNHDRSFALGSAPHCAPRLQQLAVTIQAATSNRLTPAMKRFLGSLSPLAEFRWGEATGVAFHSIVPGRRDSPIDRVNPQLP